MLRVNAKEADDEDAMAELLDDTMYDSRRRLYRSLHRIVSCLDPRNIRVVFFTT